MVRRRRNVVLVVLVLGVAWFAVMPFFSKDNAKDDAKDQNHPVMNKHRILKELDSSFSLNKMPRSNELDSDMDSNNANSDDLSEITYDQNEKNSVQGYVDKQLKSRFMILTPTAGLHRRRGPIPTPLPENVNVSSFLGRMNAPGHKGRMVRIDPKSLSAFERKVYDSGWEKYFHNEYVNNMISPQRILPDVRDPACRSLEYSNEISLDASVIIVLHNEAWMTLTRTIHSVIDRTPADLLKEIILVDDGSTFNHLNDQLTKYVSHISKVRLVRLKPRGGASHARQIGASFATGSVLVFLDAHCECTKGWLEPLLAHIAQNASNVAIPVIDLIDDSTFAYRAYDSSHIKIGGFDWSLAYRWIDIPDHEKRRRNSGIDPIRNPVMWGGIFAISHDFFNKLYGFDQSLHMSGAGQNIEMSFKIWLCGGTLETIPCSHVGHLLHNQRGSSQLMFSNEALMNSASVAHMWLDEYKDMHFKKMGLQLPSQATNRSTANRLSVSERLQCRSFDWYLRNVFPDLFAPSLALAYGKIRSKMRLSSQEEGKSPLCLLLSTENQPSISKCRSIDDKNKLWSLSRLGEIRQGDSCLDYPGSSVLIYTCHGGKGNQEWSYREDRTIYQVGTRRCLTISANGRSLLMQECSGSDHQIWFWKRNSEGETTGAVEKRITVKQQLAVDNL